MKIINPFQITDWPIKKFLIIIISLQLCVLGTIGLDYIGFNIQIIRTLTCFVYLSFIPGALVLRLLKIHKLNSIEFLLYSTGLSISILMFVGLFINYFFPIIGISKPLALIPLVFSLTVLVLILCVLCYIKDNNFSYVQYFELNNLYSSQLFFVFLLPLLSVLGTYAVNFYQNNLLLLGMLFLISSIVFLVGWSSKIPKKLYPIIIISISISMLFYTSLISMYLYGWDINIEYYYANLVKLNSFWDPNIYGDCNAMLSVVLLPPIYSTLMKLEITWIFKVIYPIIFSLVPVGLYQIFEKQSDEEIGFFASFFFISVFTFFSEMTSLMRQEIAQFFLILLTLLMTKNNGVSGVNKSILTLIFSISIVVSHYASSYLYIVILILVYSIQIALKNQIIRKLFNGVEILKSFQKSEKKYTYNHSQKLFSNFNYIILFSVTALSWYICASKSSAFESIVYTFYHIITNLFSAFLDPTAVESVQILSKSTTSVSHIITKYMHLINILFIIIGILSIFLNKKSSKRYFKLMPEYFLFSLSFFIICVAGFAIPYFASAFNTSRLYHFCLMFLALFGIIGGKIFFEFFFVKLHILTSYKKSSTKLLSLFFIIFFLLNSGWVYEIRTDYPTSYSLSQNWIKENGDESLKIGFYDTVLQEQDVFSAIWLHNYKNSNCPIYGDFSSKVNVLTSYGMAHNLSSDYFLSKNMYELDNNSYIYLRYCNTVENFGNGPQRNDFWSTKNIFGLLNNKFLLYSNGESKIYKS